MARTEKHRELPLGLSLAFIVVGAAVAAYFAGRSFSGVAAFAVVTIVLAGLYLLGLVALRVVSVRELQLFRELLPFSSPSTVEEVPL